MSLREDDFRKRLLATFQSEAEEHLRAISAGLIELEKSPTVESRMEILEIIFREAHSLKGAARAVNLSECERLCQSMESIFALWKRQEAPFSPALFDSLHQAVDHLFASLLAVDSQRTPHEPSVSALVRQLGSVLHTAQAQPQATIPLVPTPPSEPVAASPTLQPIMPSTQTIRLSAERLNTLLLQSEELLSAKLAVREHARTLRAIKTDWSLLRREHIRHALGAAQALADFEYKLAAQVSLLEQTSRSLNGMVDNLLNDLKQVLMLPFASLVEAFPKLVRDLSREQGKEVTLVIQGAEIEIGRRVLEAMKDPLMHLLRNCIDHGIEMPAERERKGKPRQGTILLTLTQLEGNQVELRMTDDGAGIDLQVVKAAALKRGILSAAAVAALNEQDTQALIFQSGMTTSALLTEVSGRGLGLAIVRQKVSEIGGTIALQTALDVGTTFSMQLPLTLATSRGILIRVDEQPFVLNTLSVEQVVRLAPSAIHTIENRACVRLADGPVPLIRLADVLEMPGQSMPSLDNGKLSVVVLGAAEQRIAFVVDEIVGEQEVLVRSLGPQLTRVRNVVGASILGSGQVVPILNTSDLLRSAIVCAASVPPAIPPPSVGAPQRSILIAEDSITARTLLKSILEAAGYLVQTAVDGAEALATLKAGNFHLVVSDVEMPRMNGFDLTREMRSDPHLAALPVILVTALESREDRARGIEVGANAYIAKSSFAQSNLLDVIQRFI